MQSSESKYNKDEFKKTYHKLGSYKRTAEHYDTSIGVVRRLCYKWKIPHQHNNNKRIIIEKDVLQKVYETLQCAELTGKHFNCSEPTIRKLIRQYGIERQLQPFERIKHNFFSEETPESFYWAGFIAADGCITIPKNGQPICAIKLALKDIVLLEHFKLAINANNTIYKYKTKNKFKKKKQKTLYTCSLSIVSAELAEDLKKFNIVPRKTKTYKFPKWLIDHPLRHHFMRGYFDGDGSISIIAGQGKFVVAGNLSFLKEYQKILVKDIGISFTKIGKAKESKYTYKLSYGGNNIIDKINDYLYANTNQLIRLERKFLLLEQIKHRPSASRKTGVAHILDALNIGHMHLTDIANYCIANNFETKSKNPMTMIVSMRLHSLVQRGLVIRTKLCNYRLAD